VWSPETGELWWSDNLFRIFNLQRDSVTPTLELVLEMTHPEDRKRQAEELDRIREGATDQSFDFRIVRSDGSIRHLRSALTRTNDRRWPKRILGTVQDLTARRPADSQIAALLLVIEALIAWESFKPGAERLIRSLCQATDCVAGVLWVPEDGELAAGALWRAAGLENAAGFEAATWKLRLVRGEGLPGRLWQSGAAIALGNVDTFPGYIRTKQANEAGLRSALAFPVLSGTEVLAVVELYSCGDVEPSERVVRSLNGIGKHLGHFLARRRGDLGQALLTPRELEVLLAAARGNSRAGIAQLLTVSLATVNTHFEHIYEKLGVSDRAAAVAKAVREGLIE
jgi:DNA-binding CsgD family transcriptional regulator